MTKKVLIPVLSICIAGCASERLQVTVTDSDGNPISNAVVHVGFSTSHVIFGGGHTSSKKGGHAEAYQVKNSKGQTVVPQSQDMQKDVLTREGTLW